MSRPAQLRASGTRTPGALILTNYRLLFESGGATPQTMLETPLRYVSNLHEGSNRYLLHTEEFLTVECRAGRFVFEIQGATQWRQWIHWAISQLPAAPVPSPPASHGGAGHGAVPVVVNVQPAAAPKIMLPCRNCGSLFDVSLGRCDRCGAPFR